MPFDSTEFKDCVFGDIFSYQSTNDPKNIHGLLHAICNCRVSVTTSYKIIVLRFIDNDTNNDFVTIMFGYNKLNSGTINDLEW